MGSLWHQKLKDSVTNKFYFDLLTNWQKMLESISYTNPMNMPLWYNPHISRSTLFNKQLYSKGCVYISDICKNDGQILSCEELIDVYHQSCNFLEYHRLKMGLTYYLKRFIFWSYDSPDATHSK